MIYIFSVVGFLFSYWLGMPAEEWVFKFSLGLLLGYSLIWICEKIKLEKTVETKDTNNKIN